MEIEIQSGHHRTYVAKEEDVKVTEDFGRCRECYKFAVLGNGLCVRCWDRIAEVKQPL